MLKTIQQIHPFFIVLLATLLEVAGDTLIRKCIYNYEGTARVLLLLLGAVLVFGYGFCLNLAGAEFRELVGIYITCLFIVWQISSFIVFRSVPTLPVIAGGAFIITGGMIITFWKP